METRTSLLRGGLDLVTPAIAMEPGHAIFASNYESDPAGYRRSGQFEAFDGRLKPSGASYWVLPVTETTAVAGMRITGSVSSTVAEVLIAGDGFLVLGDVSGSFSDGEALLSNGSIVATAAGDAEERGATNDDEEKTWHKAAVEARRAKIGPVPGSGPVRGIWGYKGNIWAFRDTADGTAGALHKATSNGWERQDLGSLLNFDASTVQFTEGKTVTGGSSGATAKIARAVLVSGNWDANGAGFLCLTDVSGTFQDNEMLTDDGSPAGSARVLGALQAVTLPAGGRYVFTNHNFYGAEDRERMYGANGVGQAFEWDGTAFAPIRTGVEASKDKPTQIEEFKEHLFLGYASGAILVSELGEPLQYQVIGGAGEVGFGNEVTNIVGSYETSLIVLGKSKTAYLTGSSTADFALETINDETGAWGYTAQVANKLIYMDPAGVRDLQSTQNYGKFGGITLTDLIQPVFERYIERGVTPVASMAVQKRKLYRLFMSDQSAVSIYVGRRQPECMLLNYPFQTFCAAIVDNGIFGEVALVGAEDGYVYELDAGRSANGEALDYYLQLPFNSFRTPMQDKCYYKVALEVQGDGQSKLSVSTEYGYGNPDQPPSLEQSFDVSGGGGFWDRANWNEAYWSSEVIGTAEAYIDGQGPNVSAGIMGSSDFEEPHILSSVTVHFTYAGQII